MTQGVHAILRGSITRLDIEEGHLGLAEGGLHRAGVLAFLLIEQRVRYLVVGSMPTAALVGQMNLGEAKPWPVGWA